jgi:hypothetical protein
MMVSGQVPAMPVIVEVAHFIALGRTGMPVGIGLGARADTARQRRGDEDERGQG